MSYKKAPKTILSIVLALSCLAFFFTNSPSVSAATTQNAVVNTKETPLTVRNGPGTQYKKVGSLKKGASVTVYAKTQTGWSEIRYNSKKAYVSTRYLKFSPAKITKQNYKNLSDITYPQISGLKKTAQDKINKVLKAHAKKSYASYLETQQREKEAQKDVKQCKEFPYSCQYEYTLTYQVKYNQDGKLSILVYDYTYEGGAHGLAAVTSYNFTISSGSQVKINNILTSSNKYQKVQKYAYTYMKKHPEIFYVTKQSEVPVHKNSQFYYTSDGIYLIFQSYEVGPYSSGHPTVKVPSSVYK